MLVSIIIPCYNGEKFLANLTEKLMNQSYKNIEIIFVDDGSKDNSLKIMKELKKQYPDFIKIIEQPENGGCGKAKIDGMNSATGEYIMQVDCDDYIDDNYIEEMVKVIENKHSVDLVISGFRKVDMDGNIIYTRTHKNELDAMHQHISVCGKLYKTSWFKKQNFNLPAGRLLDDVLFNVSIILKQPQIALCDLPGYNYVYNQNSVSQTSLKTFPPHAIEIAMEHMISLKKQCKTQEQKETLAYYAFHYACWHLLKSGANVGSKAMKIEYKKTFAYLETEFPLFKKTKKISLFRMKHERAIIRMVLFGVRILYKIHLSSFFFTAYSKMNLEKLWPKL